MPLYGSIRRNAITRSNAYPALLAIVLAGLGASLFGSSQAAGAPDKSSPTAPTNLRLVGAQETEVTVAWGASTDNVGVEGYRVNISYHRVKTKETRYTELGLACGTTYTVEVRAYDHSRNLSEPASAVVATTPCLDVTPPSPPTGLQQIARSPSTATLAWEPSSDNVAVAGYALSLGGIQVETTTEPSFTFIALRCGSTYSVAVRAYDVAGNDTAWVPYYLTTSPCGDVTSPSAPTGLVQIDRTQPSISFAWAASTDNVGVARYSVFRNGTQFADTTALTYAFQGLTCGTTYTIGVEAVDGAGNRSQRTTATMSTASCSQPPSSGGDTQPPSAPSNLAVGSATTSAIALSWSPSTDNVGVVGYDVFRDDVRISVVTTTSYTYSGLSCGQTYQLGVQANDAAGNHSSRASVVASTSPCADSSPPSPPGNLVLLSRTGTSVTVSWAASSDNVGVAGYGAYVDGSFVGPTGGTTYTFTGLACGTGRTFGIDAYDAAGNRSSRTNVVLQTAACGDTQPPSTPTQLAVSGVGQTSVTLSWSASSDNVGVAGYDVFSNGSKVATVTGTSHAFGSLACGTSYTLGVEAFDAAGNRSGRPTLTASTAACAAPPPPPPSGANVFVSPSGNDANACTQAAPCASFNRAYAVAQPGETVQVAGGTYPMQQLDWRSGRDSASAVVFRPAGQVTIQGNLQVYASGVHIAGQATGTVTNWRARTYTITVTGDTAVVGDSAAQYPHNVTLEGIDTGAIGTYNSDNAVVRDVDAGPVVQGTACNRPQSKIGPNIEAELGAKPRNVLWERVVVHGNSMTLASAQAQCHTGGLFIVSVDGLTIRESIFADNIVYNVQVQNYVGSPAKNVTIENSWFGCPVTDYWVTPKGCNGQASLQFNANSTFSDWLVRFNSFTSQYAAWGNGSYANVRFVGNVGRAPGSNVCGGGGVSFQQNAWTSGTCGTSDVLLSALPFVSTTPGQEDLHLTTGPAVDLVAGSGADFQLASDIDGQSRPGARDAGADEVG